MAAAARNLRAVEAGEKPAPRRKQTVAEAAATGDELALAVAVRTRLAAAISGDCPPRDLAALTKRLEDVVEKIKVLTAAAGEKEADGGVPGDEAFDPSAI